MHTIEQIPQLPLPEGVSWQQRLLDSIIAVGGSLLVTGIIGAYHLYPTIPNISMAYLLLILLLASIRGRYAALLAAVIAALSFDFFLVPPFYSFTIARWEEWLALFVFLATALITSQLTLTMRHSIEQARLREREARILYEAGRVINSTDRLDEQLDSVALSLVRVFASWGLQACALLLPDEDGALSMRADAPISIERFSLSHDAMAMAQEVMAQGKILELNEASPTSPGQHVLLRLLPLKSSDRILGVLCLHIEHGVSWFASKERMQKEQEQPADQVTFFWTFLDQTILIIERARLRARVLATGS
jgi:K+-sensing histidine kinase KdpD